MIQTIQILKAPQNSENRLTMRLLNILLYLVVVLIGPSCSVDRALVKVIYFMR